jgi:hypothetical protein
MAERPDLDLRGVRNGALIIVAGIVFAVLAAWWLLRLLGPAANTPQSGIDARGGPAAPRLQSAPQPDRAAYFDEKARQLADYGWVDRQAGVARIPLEEAMRLMAAKASHAAKADNKGDQR